MNGQSVSVVIKTVTARFELPNAADEVLPGIPWGSIDAFPSPAYWRYQAYVRRLEGVGCSHRIGTSFAEEAGACILGGHGLSAAVGIAAFKALRDRGIFATLSSKEDIEKILRDPIAVGQRKVRYRFARQKAVYLAALQNRLASAEPPMVTGVGLRDWLLLSPGIGPKTASWIARNWLDADDVAILDVHILRAGLLGGFFARGQSVTRDYGSLERQFIAFSHALGVRPSELDAIIWKEMMNSGKTVARILRT